MVLTEHFKKWILKYFISVVGESQKNWSSILVSTHLDHLESSHGTVQPLPVQVFLSI